MSAIGYSTARLVLVVVIMTALGGVIGYGFGAAVVELWFRPGGDQPVREVAAAPYVFTVVGCLVGTLAGMAWVAVGSAIRAIRSGDQTLDQGKCDTRSSRFFHGAEPQKEP
jgi:hypothetical protein